MATSAADDKAAPADRDNQGEVEHKKVSYFSLYRHADRMDYLLMALGTLGALGNGAAWPIFSILFAQFIDDLGGGGTTKGISADMKHDLDVLATYFVYLGIGCFVCSYLEACMWMWTGNRQTNRIRELYLAAVLRQDVEFFDAHSTTGGLLGGLSEDSVAFQQATSEKVGAFLHHMTTFVIGFAVSFSRGWDMTLIMCGCLPFLIAVGALMARASSSLAAKAQAAYSKANAVAQQAITRVRTVVAYGHEERAIQEYDAELEVPLKVGQRQGIVSGLMLGSVNLVFYTTFAIGLFYGAWRIVHQRFGSYYSGGQVLNVVIASLLGGFSLGQAVPHLSAFTNGRMAAARIFGVMARKPRIDLDDAGEAPQHVTGALELRNVAFCYPSRPDIPVFQDFSLVIPAGKTVALVGSSGSGKSTVVQLIERFYDPNSGQVLLDGIDLRRLQLRWLRAQMALVSQEPTLFATTIYENIAMGRKGASLEEVQQAAQLANAHRFITALPHRYDTHVGERGLLLSGGQKQRIAIARAILKNPKVLLLDEATSALDTGGERAVQEALDRVMVGRTSVVVAHRLSTVRGADSIAVLRGGQVVEQGTHAELLEAPAGAYSMLVHLQLMAADKQRATAGQPHVVAGLEGGGGDSLVATEEIEGGEQYPVEVLVVKPSAPRDSATPSPTNAKPTGSKAGSVASSSGGQEAEEAAGRQASMLRLAKLNAPEWPYAVMGALGALVAGSVQPSFALVLASMIATFFRPKETVLEGAKKYVGLFVAVGVGALATNVVVQYCFTSMGQRLTRRLRVMLLRNILRQEVAFFDFPQHSSGALVTRLSEDTTHIRGAFGDTLALICQNVVCLSVGYIIAFIHDWRMALVVTGILPLLVSSSVIWYRFTSGFNSAADKLYTEANQTVTDAFSSIRVIHAYNLQAPIGALYKRLMSPGDAAMRRNSNLTGASMGYSNFMGFGLYAVIVWFGSEEVASGRATFDDMIKAFMAVLLAARGIAQAQVGFPDISKAKLAIRRVFPLLDRESGIDASSPDGFQGAPLQGAIELRDIVFHYPARPQVPVFERFSLAIPAGTSMALVGESGSGKSTVVGLIERFYDPLGGAVLLDGRDLREYCLSWVRSQMALVSQEPLLFSSTIVDNIRYGKPHATIEEVTAAARAANAHDFIEALPEGYNTLIGDKGLQLSGGQKQRVAIARAVVKDPRVLLLDEATSALDAAAEQLVQEALDRIMVGRTSVVVAHRLSTVRNAGCIAFLERGVIVEQGRHEVLVEAGGGVHAAGATAEA